MNNNIKEPYCSFEVSKLLKEKGFRQNTLCYYFEDGVLPAAFFSESELGIQVALTTSNDAAAEFLSFSLSRVKLGGADKADGEGGVVRTYPFTALLNSAGGAGTANEASTIAIQDSLA